MPPVISKSAPRSSASSPPPSSSEIQLLACRGSSAITMDQAKKYLGWTEETATEKFGDDHLFVDELGKKIRCENNTRNRPFNLEWAKTLAQDILNRKWRFNGESIIIGNRKQVLSAQHRLIGLVLACQMWDQDKHWHTQWKTRPVLESVVVIGVDESEDCVQTLDNVRTRTLADTLYTSALFREWKPKDKKVVVRITDHAVRLLWDRTGMAESKYAGHMTNSEAYDFLNRHLRLLNAVKVIHVEDQNGSIQSRISKGHAAGLLYLQAASDDDRSLYETNNPPSEAPLGFSRWDDAEKFWTLFSISSKFEELRRLLSSGDDDEEHRLEVSARIGIIIKAWKAFVAGEPLTEDVIDLSYDMDAVGNRTLSEFPCLGGIDVGGESDETVDEDI